MNITTSKTFNIELSQSDANHLMDILERLKDSDHLIGMSEAALVNQLYSALTEENDE